MRSKINTQQGFGLIGLLIVVAIIVIIAVSSMREMKTGPDQKTLQENNIPVSSGTQSYQGAIDSAKEARDMLEHPNSNP